MGDSRRINDFANEGDDIAGILAYSLNLSVVAEGVETQDQFDFLMAHHCETV